MEENIPNPAPREEAIRTELARFFGAHLGSAPASNDRGSLRMLCKHCKANKNGTPKEKLINWMLLRTEERLLLPDVQPSPADLTVCDFLVSELQALVRSRLK